MWTADLPPVKWVAKEHIAVLGAGLMGHSIAYVFAAKGHLVSVTDPDPGALAGLNNRVDRFLNSLSRIQLERAPALSSRPRVLMTLSPTRILSLKRPLKNLNSSNLSLIN